jgi:hypothetical protein
MSRLIDVDACTGESFERQVPVATRPVTMKHCYQCLAAVTYLFADGRGSCCTRLTPEEVRGDITTAPAREPLVLVRTIEGEEHLVRVYAVVHPGWVKRLESHRLAVRACRQYLLERDPLDLGAEDIRVYKHRCGAWLIVATND